MNLRPKHLISPVGLSLASYSLFLICLLIPGDWYSQLAREPYLLGQSYEVFIFYSGCILAFICGSLVYRACFGRSDPYSLAPVRPQQFRALRLMWIPLSLIVALNVYSGWIIAGNSHSLFENLFSGRGDVAKLSINTEGSLSNAQPLLIAAIGWALYRYLQFKPFMIPRERKVHLSIIALAVGLSATLSILKVARYEVIPLIVGLMITVALLHYRNRKMAIGRLAVILVLPPAILLSAFLAFSYLRGFDTSEKLLASLIGYGPASFNHLAALLDGTLVFPYGGKGGYTFPFVLFLPLVHNLVDFKEIIGLPDLAAIFLSEFSATQRAGLNNSFIWVTAFGQYYTDLGYYTAAYVFVTGFVTEAIWRSFLRGGSYGAILYPFFASSILLWFSSNMLVRPALITTLGAAAVFAAFEHLVARSQNSDRWRNNAALTQPS